MTCAHVRDRLLEDAVSDWGPLEPHLRTCPACAATAARITGAEAEITHHLETFMTARTLDAPWASAVAAVPIGGRSRSRFLIPVLISLAAAAALALGLWPGDPEPTDPIDPPQLAAAVVPVGLTTAREALAQLRSIDGEIPTGLSRKDEDQLQMDVLQQRVAAMTAAETAYLTLIDDPEWQVEALTGLGDLYAEMGEALSTSPTPTYLDPAQAAVYRETLEQRAVTQLARATDAWDRALAVGGSDAAIEARRAEAATRIGGASAALERALGQLRAAMARCPGSREATAVAAKAERALADGEADVGLVDQVSQVARALRCE